MTKLAKRASEWSKWMQHDGENKLAELAKQKTQLSFKQCWNEVKKYLKENGAKSAKSKW